MNFYFSVDLFALDMKCELKRFDSSFTIEAFGIDVAWGLRIYE